MAIAKKVEVVDIKPIERKTISVRIVGDSPLITHCWDVKAKREILEKELQITKTKREKKNPYADFASSMYWLDPMPGELTKENIDAAIESGARFGFPLTGIKQATISSAFRMKWSKDKMSLRGAFYIKPDFEGYYAGDLVISDDQKHVEIIPNQFHSEPMIEIHAEKVTMREDCVRVGQGSADLRYRAQFDNWYCDLQIDYNENGPQTIDQIMTFIEAGGYVCGIGEWRPERDGQYGMYHVLKS